MRGGAEVSGHDNGKFSMLGSYFLQGVKQVLKLFAVDEPECMEIFPAGRGVQVEPMFKRFQTDVDEPNCQGGIFRYPVYNQTGCVRDVLGRTNLTVPHDNGATSYLLDIRGSTENTVGKFERSVIIAEALDENNVCTEFGYLFNGRRFLTPLVQGKNPDLLGVRSQRHLVVLHSGSGNGREKVCNDDAVRKPDGDAKQTDPGTEDQPCNERRKGENEAASPYGQ